MSDLNDFEAASTIGDYSMGRSDPVTEELIDAMLSQDEREAIEFSELFANPDVEDKYFFACIYRGLNPVTQELWTDEEAAIEAEVIGFDPRNIADWFAEDERIKEAVRKYKEGRGL